MYVKNQMYLMITSNSCKINEMNHI